MKGLNHNDELIKSPLDLALFGLSCFLFIMSMVQLLIVIEGDIYHEQSFMNICWIISVMALLVVLQLKATAAITRIKKKFSNN